MAFLNKAPIYLLGSLLNAGIPVLLLPVLTRVLTPTDYGHIAMFSAAVSAFGALAGLSVHGAVWVRYFDRSKQELAEYISTCLIILLASIGALTLIVLFFQRPLIWVTGLDFTWLLMAIAVAACQFVISVRLTLWQVAGNAVAYGSFQSAQGLVDAALSLTFVLLIYASWQSRVAAIILTAMLAATGAVVLLSNAGMLTAPRKWRSDAQNALGFGVPLIPHAIGTMLIATSDRFIVNAVAGTTAVGTYTVAMQVASAVGVLGVAFNKAFGPWLFKRLSENSLSANRSIVKTIYSAMFAVVLIAVIFSAVGKMLFPILLGSEFYGIYILVLLMSLGFAFHTCYLLVAGFIFYAEKTRILSIITASCGLINIATTFLLTFYFGLIGAAISFLAINIFFFLMSWLAASQLRIMPWFEIWHRNPA